MEDQRSHRSRWTDTWLPEICCVFISIASLLAIITLLVHFDGKLLFHWHRLAPNTVVSILATLSRITLMVAVSSALGQWRWNWFANHPRPLSDFATLDSASRGSMGSLTLLWRTKSLATVAIGAWVTITAVAFDPFVQQLLSFRTDLVFEDSAVVRVATAQHWSGGGEVLSRPFSVNAPDESLNFPMQGSILFGFSAGASTITQQVPTHCPSGNCEWDSFNSLAVCSRCVDVSDQIVASRSLRDAMTYSWPMEGNPVSLDLVTTFQLPNGQILNNLDNGPGRIEMTARATSRPSETLTFRESTTLIQAVSMIRARFSGDESENSTQVPISATECAIYFCVNSYKSRILNGTLFETSTEVISERDMASWQPVPGRDNKTVLPGPAEDALVEPQHLINRTDFAVRLPPSKSDLHRPDSFNVTSPALEHLSLYIKGLFNDSAKFPIPENYQCTGLVRQPTMNVPEDGGNRAGSRFAPPIMQVLYSTPSLKDTFANLAASISANMRATADEKPSVRGRAGSYESFIEVRWPWLALPCTCVIMGSLFLLLAIRETREAGVPVWKNDALAAITHGLESAVIRMAPPVPYASRIKTDVGALEFTLGEHGKLRRASQPPLICEKPRGKWWMYG